MDTTWIIIVSVIVIVAAASTIRALVAERAPRIHVDPERLARLRERLGEEQDVSTPAQRRLRTDRVSAERLWAGGL